MTDTERHRDRIRMIRIVFTDNKFMVSVDLCIYNIY